MGEGIVLMVKDLSKLNKFEKSVVRGKYQTLFRIPSGPEVNGKYEAEEIVQKIKHEHRMKEQNRNVEGNVFLQPEKVNDH